MFKNTFQSGFLSILYSIGSKPLQIWDKKVRNGHIKRITDQDIQVKISTLPSPPSIVNLAEIFIHGFLSVLRAGDRGNQREHHLHHLPGRPQEDPGHQAALPRHDREEHEEIFHIRGPGPR